MNNYIQQPLNGLNRLYLCITEHDHFLPRFLRSVVGIYDYQTKVHAKLSFILASNSLFTVQSNN